jgi:hypothetical protein
MVGLVFKLREACAWHYLLQFLLESLEFRRFSLEFGLQFRHCKRCKQLVSLCPITFQIDWQQRRRQRGSSSNRGGGGGGGRAAKPKKENMHK